MKQVAHPGRRTSLAEPAADLGISARCSQHPPTDTLPRIKRVSRKLADGTQRTYYYHRDTGAPLPGAHGSREFLLAYAAAEAVTPDRGATVSELICDYLMSASFRKKADSTRREYIRMLGKLEAKFGKLPIKALESPRIRGVFNDYHEEIARHTPREADNRLTVLSAVFNHAIDKTARLTHNPLARFERLHSGNRSQLIWTEAPIRQFMQTAPIELQRALILALHTGQRYGDLIWLRWTDYDGAEISLRQGKSRRPVLIPCTGALKRMLDGTPRVGPVILTREDGRPWFTEGNDKELGKAWTRHMKACGLYHADRAQRLEFRDLRGTAVTLLSEAGCSVPMIVAITGHTMQSAHRILESYLARTRALSQAAIVRFENSEATAFANRLQTGRAAEAETATTARSTAGFAT